MGIAAGCVACAVFGGLRAPDAGDGSWFTQPKLLPHGFAFDWKLLPPFVFIYLVSMLEAMGDLTATAQLSGLPTEGPTHWRRISGGVMADGIVSTTAALFGCFPSATYAQNNGVIQITGVASRRVAYLMAALLAQKGFTALITRLYTSC